MILSGNVFKGTLVSMYMAYLEKGRNSPEAKAGEHVIILCFWSIFPEKTLFSLMECSTIFRRHGILNAFNSGNELCRNSLTDNRANAVCNIYITV